MGIRVLRFGFIIWGLGFRDQDLEYRIWGLGFRDQDSGLGLGVRDLEFMVYVLGFMVYGLWFMVYGL